MNPKIRNKERQGILKTLILQPLASRYFFLISLPLLFRSLSIVLGSCLRGTHDTRTPMRINLAANALNVILNYLLIYVLALGVTGAAIATALSTVVSGVWMLFCFRKSEPLYFKRELFRPDVNLLKEGGRIGFPVLATGVTSCLGYVVFAAMITGLGKVVFAAHSIAVTAEEIFYIPGYGLRSATQTLIGNSVGEQNHAKFRSVSRVSILLTLLMMCLNGLLLYLSAYPLMKLFTNADEVARIGASVLRLVAFSEPFFGLLIVIEGIF